jgi:hypothetical protein
VASCSSPSGDTGDADAEDHEPDTDAEPADDEEPTADDLDEIRDPRAKIEALSEANARLVRKVEARDAEIARLNEGGESEAVRDLRLENAFLRAVVALPDPIRELDDAWTLGNNRGFFDTVEIADDGTVTGMDDALDRLADRYPWLLDPDAPSDRDDGPPKRGTPKPPRRKSSENGPTPAELRGRFPALRRGRR